MPETANNYVMTPRTDVHHARLMGYQHSGPLNKNDIAENDVIGEDALYQSMCKCVQGVLWKDSAAAFYLRGAERCGNLSRDLRNGTYKPKPPVHFRITHPKPRNIASVAFRDRVYQRSLNDNVVYPLMTKSFIYDNYACQQGKGTDTARERMKTFLRQHYRERGTDGYCLQIDIHGYYPNMRHDVAEACFREKLPDWAFERAQRILREQYPGPVGYDPGSQLVQIAGISVLDKLDHFIKEKLRVRKYIRYMDDLQLIHHDRDYLEQCLAAIEAELKKIGFELNPKKTRIFPLSEGILFLGFYFLLTSTGKVLMRIDPRNVKAEQTKLRRLAKLVRQGKRTRACANESFRAWKVHASKGNNYKLLKRMDHYYQSLWEECINDHH